MAPLEVAQSIGWWLFEATKKMFYIVSPSELALNEGDHVPNYSASLTLRQSLLAVYPCSAAHPACRCAPSVEIRHPNVLRHDRGGVGRDEDS